MAPLTTVDRVPYVGLSLLLSLSFAPSSFSPVFPSSQKPTFPNSNSIWNARTRLSEFIGTPKCFVGEQNAILLFSFLVRKNQFTGTL